MSKYKEGYAKGHQHGKYLGEKVGEFAGTVHGFCDGLGQHWGDGYDQAKAKGKVLGKSFAQKYPITKYVSSALGSAVGFAEGFCEQSKCYFDEGKGLAKSQANTFIKDHKIDEAMKKAGELKGYAEKAEEIYDNTIVKVKQTVDHGINIANKFNQDTNEVINKVEYAADTFDKTFSGNFDRLESIAAKYGNKYQSGDIEPYVYQSIRVKSERQ